MVENPYRALPSISELSDVLTAATIPLAGASLTALCQQILATTRAEIDAGATPTREGVIAAALTSALRFERTRLEPAINATGVIIHTNLGRAPISAAAAEAMREAAASYVPLEIEPETNERGGRMSEISELMRLLTGADATLVVNNNAAAVLLVLSAIGAGKSVIVSRGEAVEIGGGFRIPDVLRQSGARLIEVGTTNRTYLRDYESAIEPDTAAFLKVHASNFTIGGFTASTGIDELAALSQRTGIPVIEDLGSGALLDTGQFGLASEPTIGDRLRLGADLITASGDKLLGGPQAGIIAGRADLVARVSRHPLARAVRADKTCLAGLVTTLRQYASGSALAEIPIWRMISATSDALRARAETLKRQLPETVQALESASTVGGGSLPGQTQPSFALSIAPVDGSVDALAMRLRSGRPRVFGRIEADRLLLDLRTVPPEDDERLLAAVTRAISAEHCSRCANPGSRGSPADSGSSRDRQAL